MFNKLYLQYIFLQILNYNLLIFYIKKKETDNFYPFSWIIGFRFVPRFFFYKIEFVQHAVVL